MFTHTISARELQTGYRKVLAKAQKVNKPIVIITNNKPVGAVISMDLLKELEQMALLNTIARETGSIYGQTSNEDLYDVTSLVQNVEKIHKKKYKQRLLSIKGNWINETEIKRNREEVEQRLSKQKNDKSTTR